jgi:hypothetical protein
VYDEKRVKWKAALVFAFSYFWKGKSILWPFKRLSLLRMCLQYTEQQSWLSWTNKMFYSVEPWIIWPRGFWLPKKHHWNTLLRNLKSYIYFLDVWGLKSSSFPSCKTNLVFQTKKRKTILKESFFKHGFPEPILFQKHNS